MPIKQIARTVVGNYVVSTVELPFGSTFEEEVFETMVFNTDEYGEIVDSELDVERCTGKAMAIAIHALLVNKWGNK